MAEQKKLPLGIEDFEEIIKEDFYYVDKTALIAELVENWNKVNLFTRPRRFGKSLNMSMLRHFFEIGGDRHLFDGLKISEKPAVCEAYMGKFPVVFVSLKSVNALDFAGAYDMLCAVIRQEVERLDFLQNSPKLSESEKMMLKALTESNPPIAVMKNSLRMLTAALEKHYGQETILLIDEYDVPLDKAYVNGYYREMLDVIRGMFDAALKTNSSLQFAVLTGCLRVSKESIFTGLNNMKVHSISDVRFDEYFGFTDAEVREMLSAYKLDVHYEDMRAWYDGYRFGGQYVYCPWDVINYCYDLRADPECAPKAYWINTSGNDMVRMLIDESADGAAQMDIEQLIAGETITKSLNEQLTHSEIRENIDNIWSFLYMTGYLTVTERPSGSLYSLRIPNQEVREIYKQQVLAWFKDKTKSESADLAGLYTAFETGDTAGITEMLSSQLYDTISYYDAYESFYHGFLLALLSTCRQWSVTSNVETGRGRCDIMVWRRDRTMGFVVELKNVKEEEALETACNRAMEQIKRQDYGALFRKYGIRECRAYGIAFWNKCCLVRTEIISKRTAG